MGSKHPWAGRSTEKVGPDPKSYDADYLHYSNRLGLSQARYLANLRRPKNGRTRRLVPEWKPCRTCKLEFHRGFNSNRIWCESCADSRQQASNRRSYQRRRDARLCVVCGAPADGWALCRSCRARQDQQRDHARQSRTQKALRTARRAMGLCTRCAAPSDGPRCEGCLADLRPGARMRKRRWTLARRRRNVAEVAPAD